MRRPGTLVHHKVSDFSEDSDYFKDLGQSINMQHYDLGDGVRVGIGHANFDSEDSTESSEFSQGFNAGLGQGQGFNSGLGQGQGFNSGLGHGVNVGQGQGFNTGQGQGFNSGLGQGFNIDRSGEIKREQFNVKTPFRQLINGFHANERIRIVGKHTSNCWAMDLCRGQERIFHLSSRLDQRCIVRNDQLNGRWNNEEREGGQPLEKSKMFTMDLVSIRNGDAVQILINGRKFADFETRERLEAADRLEISAGIEVHKLGLYDEDD